MQYPEESCYSTSTAASFKSSHAETFYNDISASVWMRLQCAQAGWELLLAEEEGCAQRRACITLQWAQLTSNRCWEVGGSSPSQIILSWSYPFVMIRKYDRAEIVVRDTACSGLQSCLWSCSRYPQQLAAGFCVHSKFPSNVQLSTARHPLVFSLSRFQPKVRI